MKYFSGNNDEDFMISEFICDVGLHRTRLQWCICVIAYIDPPQNLHWYEPHALGSHLFYQCGFYNMHRSIQRVSYPKLTANYVLLIHVPPIQTYLKVCLGTTNVSLAYSKWVVLILLRIYMPLDFINYFGIFLESMQLSILIVCPFADCWFSLL